MQFKSKNTSTLAININYNNKIKSRNTNLKFLGLVIDNTVFWKIYVEMITLKLNQVCFMIRITRSILSLGSLWGNSSQSVNIFKLQKIIIGIIMGCRPKDACGEYLKILQILPLASQYLLSVALFVIHNKDPFKMNSEIHSFNTRVTLTFSSL